MPSRDEQVWTIWECPECDYATLRPVCSADTCSRGHRIRSLVRVQIVPLAALEQIREELERERKVGWKAVAADQRTRLSAVEGLRDELREEAAKELGFAGQRMSTEPEAACRHDGRRLGYLDAADKLDARLAELDPAEQSSDASQSEARSEAAGLASPPRSGQINSVRNALWDEVHRVGGPRKSALAQIGRDLDEAIGWRVPSVDHDRATFDPADQEAEGERCRGCGGRREEPGWYYRGMRVGGWNAYPPPKRLDHGIRICAATFHNPPDTEEAEGG